MTTPLDIAAAFLAGLLFLPVALVVLYFWNEWRHRKLIEDWADWRANNAEAGSDPRRR
jgi:hypothetical protein